MKRTILLILLNILTHQLVAQEDNIIYSFTTINNKVVQLTYDETNRIFIFRLISTNRIVIEVEDDLRDNNNVFYVNGYHRGGGYNNAAMDYNDIVFSHNGFDYDIYYVWSVGEEKTNKETDRIFGLSISKDGVEICDLRGLKIITGEVYGWSFFDILPEAKDF